MTARTRAGRWYDRPHASTLVTAAVGPLTVPALDRLRAVVQQTIDLDPAGPVAAHLVRGMPRRRAAVLADRAELLVTTERNPGRTWQDAVAALAPPDDGLPFRIELGADRVLLSAWHSIGDAGVVNAILTGHLLAAGGGEDGPRSLVTPTTPGVTRALLRAGVRAALTPGALTRHPEPPPVPGTGTWSQRPAVEHVRVPRDAWQAAKRRARASGVRPSSLLVSLVEGALRDAGLAPADDVRVMVVDARRYVGQAHVRGNLSVGQALPAAWSDAAAVEQAVSGAMESGRPALGLALGYLAAVMPRPSGAASAPGAVRTVRPTYSVMGGLSGTSRLPWTGAPVFAIAPRSGRPDQVTFSTIEVQGDLLLTASFDHALPAETVAAVLAEVAAACPEHAPAADPPGKGGTHG